MADSLSEVEKLKAERRAANAAKRAAAGEDADTSAPTDEAASTSPAPATTTNQGPVAQIDKAEAKAEALMSEIPEVISLIGAAADSAALDAAAMKQAAISAGLGQLTAMMDAIDIGEIEDDEMRSAARVRRKAINKRVALASSSDVEVDGDLAAANAALKKTLLAARSALK